MLLSLVIAAKEKMDGGTEEIKFAGVAEWIYEIMPPGIFQRVEDIAGGLRMPPRG